MARKARKAAKKYEPDEIDYKLIEMLSANGRMPYADMAREVSLSETRVRLRVARLIKEGYLNIVAIPNLIKLGADQMAMIGIKAGENIEEIAELLSEDDQVTFLAICTGTFDIMIEVVCRDKESMLQLVQKIRNMPGVKNTETFMYLRTPKSMYGATPGMLAMLRS